MSDKSEITLDTGAAAAAAAAATNQPADDKLYAGKYKSVEELEKGYLEAQKLISSRGNGAANTDTTTNDNTNTQTPAKTITVDDPQASVTNAGLDWDALNAEYAEAGALSDDTYAKLEKGGIPRKEVDRYIAGRVAEAQAYDNAVFGTAGGQEQFGVLLDWAKGNLSRDEAIAFNKAVESGNVNTAKLAVEGLVSRYEKAAGRLPNLKDGKGGVNTGATPFKSVAEVTEAMRNPKYRSDPAYRKEVTERLAVSNVF